MSQPESTEPVRGPKGISGWLVLPPVQLILHMAYMLWSCRRLVSQVAELHPKLPAAAVVAGVFVLLAPWLGFLIFCLVRFFQKRQNVPLLMTIVYGLMAVLLVAYGLGYPGEQATAHALHFHPFSLALQIALCLAFIAYFHTSVRVKNTFVVPHPPSLASAEPAGIGGALLVPLAYLVIITASAIIGMAVGDLPGKTDYAIQHHHWAAIALNAGRIALAALSIVCLLLIARRKRLARWLTVADFVFWSVAAAASVSIQGLRWQSMALLVVLNGACAIYFLTSKRVKNTFVR